MTTRLMPFVVRQRRALAICLGGALFSGALAQIDALVLGYVVDHVTSATASDSNSAFAIMATASIILLAKQIVTAFVQFWQSYSGERIKTSVAANLTTYAVGRLLHTSIAVLGGGGDSVAALTLRIDRCAESLGRSVKNLVSDILPLMITAIVSLVLLFVQNTWVGFVAALVVPVYFSLSWHQARQQRGVRRAIQADRERLAGRIACALTAIPIVKSFGREHYEWHRVGESAAALSRLELQHHRVNRIYDTLKTASESLGAAAALLLTAYLILEGDLSPGAIPLTLLLYRNVTAPVRELHRLYDEHNEALALSDEFFRTADASQPEEPLVTARREHVLEVTTPPSVTISGVTFRYPGQDKNALEDVSMTIKPNSITAVVGLSGAGKTTIANVICGFYRQQAGTISWNDDDLDAVDLKQRRAAVGLVTQFPYVFDGSLADNIAYGCESASRAEVEAAATAAGLHRLQHGRSGLDRRAAGASGGEAQRIGIARAFLKDAPFLILDEPTASLDASTALEVQRAIERLAQGRTVLVISHNLALMLAADIIYVVDDGKVVQAGTHGQLVTQQGRYRDMMRDHADALRLPSLLTQTIGLTASLQR